MKRLGTFLLGLMLTSFAFGYVRHEKRLHKKLASIEIIYADAVDYMLDIQSQETCDERMILSFFGKFDLASKRNFKKLRATYKYLQRMSGKKFFAKRKDLHTWTRRIAQLYAFVQDQKNLFYVITTTQEINYFYRNYNFMDQNLVGMIKNSPKMFGIKTRRYPLYTLVKKINLDLRRIKHLFAKYKLTSNVVISLNNIKTKIMKLHSQIVATKMYKRERRAIRLWKLLGVTLLAVPFVTAAVVGVSASFVLVSPTATFVQLQSAALATEAAIALAQVGGVVLGTVALSITTKELIEAYKYKIPVHSTSLFSLFTPAFVLLAWIPRG